MSLILNEGILPNYVIKLVLQFLPCFVMMLIGERIRSYSCNLLSTNYVLQARPLRGGLDAEIPKSKKSKT